MQVTEVVIDLGNGRARAIRLVSPGRYLVDSIRVGGQYMNQQVSADVAALLVPSPARESLAAYLTQFAWGVDRFRDALLVGVDIAEKYTGGQASTGSCDPPTVYTYEVVDRVDDVTLYWQRRLSEMPPLMTASRRLIEQFLEDLVHIKTDLEKVDRG